MKPQWQIDRNEKARTRFSHCHERWAQAAALRKKRVKLKEIGIQLGVCESRVLQMIKLHEARQ